MKSIITSIVAIAVAALVLFGSGMGLSKVAAVNSEKELNEMLATVLPGNTSF